MRQQAERQRIRRDPQEQERRDTGKGERPVRPNRQRHCGDRQQLQDTAMKNAPPIAPRNNGHPTPSMSDR
ncbi:hypothetical protein GCM10022268_35380 [Sphingomonas cynarae]|uniref:Uncharacterized protein n=1 Tax=Sphingomonas cynarae TaxID=930197 RepID=A0ABP7ETM1_9SPHN